MAISMHRDSLGRGPAPGRLVRHRLDLPSYALRTIRRARYRWSMVVCCVLPRVPLRIIRRHTCVRRNVRAAERRDDRRSSPPQPRYPPLQFSAFLSPAVGFVGSATVAGFDDVQDGADDADGGRVDDGDLENQGDVRCHSLEVNRQCTHCQCTSRHTARSPGIIAGASMPWGRMLTVNDCGQRDAVASRNRTARP